MITIVSALLIPLWTAAWLHWVFRGEIRQFLFAKVFPEHWRAGRAVEDILTTDTEEFEMFLAGESQAPPFVRGVFGCPGCLSAHIATVGTAFALLTLWTPFAAIPLVWAAAAYIGHRLHKYL